MEINIIYPFKNAWKYIEEVEKDTNPNFEALWNEHLIEPYWEKISEWAPGGFSFMKPKVIKNTEVLKNQILILEALDFTQLVSVFIRITEFLPKNDDDPITVAIYPADHDNVIVRERQNGVVGACVAGNIIININPLAKDFINWIPYVFAHEYHHSVWGHNWFVLKGGLTGTFIETILSEGEADQFAISLNENLKPSWLNTISREEEIDLWRKVQPILFSTDRDIHTKYLFGDSTLNLPWCVGYHFGFAIIKSFLKSHPDLTIHDLIDIHPKDIYYKSGFERE